MITILTVIAALIAVASAVVAVRAAIFALRVHVTVCYAPFCIFKRSLYFHAGGYAYTIGLPKIIDRGNHPVERWHIGSWRDWHVETIKEGRTGGIGLIKFKTHPNL